MIMNAVQRDGSLIPTAPVALAFLDDDVACAAAAPASAVPDRRREQLHGYPGLNATDLAATAG